MADITVKIKLDSTDATIGTPVTLTAAEVLASPSFQTNADGGRRTVYLVELDLVGATLTAAKHYVEFTTNQPVATTTGDTYWVVLGASMTAGDPDSAGFGGVTYTAANTDESDVILRTEGDDLALTVGQRPDAPTDFTATIANQVLITDNQANTPDWLIRDLEYVSLTWTVTTLSADFVRYEIERTQDAGTTWETIFSITDEAVDEARDYEGLRNVEASYRMRVVASWHIASVWTAEVAVTPAMTDCALLFTSNEDPTINQGYVDIGGSRTWKFLTGEEKETHILVGRSYQVVTGPLEYRGDQFEVTLAVWAGSVPVDTGRAMFDLVESLNSVATSYICVLDEAGRRWLGDVTVTEGDRRGSKTHEAKARVIEITDTPSLVDIEN
jgi:hypothetical protein